MVCVGLNYFFQLGLASACAKAFRLLLECKIFPLDLHHENCLVDRDGSTWIIDFGHAEYLLKSNEVDDYYGEYMPERKEVDGLSALFENQNANDENKCDVINRIMEFLNNILFRRYVDEFDEVKYYDDYDSDNEIIPHFFNNQPFCKKQYKTISPQYYLPPIQNEKNPPLSPPPPSWRP